MRRGVKRRRARSWNYSACISQNRTTYKASEFEIKEQFTQFYDWYNIIYIAGEYEDLIELNKEKHEQVSDSEEHDQHEKVPESEEHHQNSNEHSKGVIINESDNDNDDSKTIEPYEQQQNKQYKNENQGT